MSRFLALLLAVIFAAPALRAEPLKFRARTDRIPDQYIVVLNVGPLTDISPLACSLAESYGGRVTAQWKHAIQGFAVSMTVQQARALSNHPLVEYVEEDTRVYVSGTQVTDTSRWNLDRVDQPEYPLDGGFSYGRTGSSVRAYVIDTGVMGSHDEFLWGAETVGTGSTRVESGFDFVGDGYAANAPCTATADRNYVAGHGTAVASVLAGRLVGVAKSARIVPVRIIGCDGSGDNSDLISAIDWVIEHYETHSYSGVINMSVFSKVSPAAGVTCPSGWSADISGTELTAFEQAVSTVINYGIPVVASANNQNTDARCTTPARIGDVITVGGTKLIGSGDSQSDDQRWQSTSPVWLPTNPDAGSNYGPAIDIFAPAANVRGAYISSTTAERATEVSRTGTSFAAPHVAGEVARFLQAKGKSTANPENALAHLLSAASLDVLSTSVPLYGAPNLLLRTVY